MSANLTHMSPTSAHRQSRAERLHQALFEVEKIMGRLALGHRVDRAGTMVMEQLATGGRRIRARLALESCAHFGVQQDQALLWAAAVELLHNATLIHDDIQDGDTQRRGHPTIWATHGAAQAINAGDLMLMLPFLAIAEMNNEERATLSELMARTATDIVRGQVEELGLLEARRLDIQSYVNACRGKTGALIALPVVGAAILGGRSLAEAEALGESFIQLGVLFQIQDDVVDLFGDKGRGKVGCDIYEGKVSALLVAQLEAAPHTESLLLNVLRKPREEKTEQDVEIFRQQYEESGALDRVLTMIDEVRREALDSRSLRKEGRLLELAARLVEVTLRPLSLCNLNYEGERAS